MSRHQGERPRPLGTDEASQSSSGGHKLDPNGTALLLDGLVELIVTECGGLVCPCVLHPAADELPTENQMSAALLRARRCGLVVPSGRRHPVLFGRPGVRPGSTCLIWRGVTSGTRVADSAAQAPDGTLGARRGPVGGSGGVA